MAGEAHIDEVLAYLSRLTGESLSAEGSVRLRSVQRAVLAAWARTRNIDLQLTRLTSSNPVPVRDLFAANTGPTVVNGGIALKESPAPLSAGALNGIGIDIEDVESLPETSDFREHSFYRDSFTPAEIAYCIRQAAPRASFCGIWAAKEAVIKAGAVPGIPTALKQIEIVRDAFSRPAFPGCSVSISHTPKTAVAVCVAFAPLPEPPPSALLKPSPSSAMIAAGERSNGSKWWPWSRSR